MKMKSALLLFVSGYLLDFIGSRMKITPQPFSDLILTSYAF